MKAIYTTIDDVVYRINQNPEIPVEMVTAKSQTGLTTEVDKANGVASMMVNINTMNNKSSIKSNRELASELFQFLKKNKVTEVPNVYNYFKVYIDYSITNGKEEVEHSAVIKPIIPVDKVMPLGVASNNECVYRRVKTFAGNIEFRLKNRLPHGIISSKETSYKIKIHNIAIFQSLYNTEEVHNSIYGVPYTIGSSSLNACLDGHVLVYSTSEAGLEIMDGNIGFQPRILDINLNITLDNMVVVYNDIDVKIIIQDNLNTKYPPAEPEVPDNPSEGSSTDYETKVPADGNFCPDKDGYIDWWERCEEGTPNGLQVVENDVPNDHYDPDKMIRQKMIIRDIPDIAIGEYVIYRETIVDM